MTTPSIRCSAHHGDETCMTVPARTGIIELWCAGDSVQRPLVFAPRRRAAECWFIGPKHVPISMSQGKFASE